MRCDDGDGDGVGGAAATPARARRTLGQDVGDEYEVTAVPYLWYSPSPLLGSGSIHQMAIN